MCAALTFHQNSKWAWEQTKEFWTLLGRCGYFPRASLGEKAAAAVGACGRRIGRLPPRAAGGAAAFVRARAAGGGIAPGRTAPNAMRAAAGSAIAPASAACRARRCGGLCLRSSGPAARWPAQRTATFGAGALATCSQFWGTAAVSSRSRWPRAVSISSSGDWS